MLLRLHSLQHLGDERLDQIRLRLSGQTFERARKADKLGRCFSCENAIELACQEHLLPFSRETACHPTPEDVCLNLAAFAGKAESCITQPPQLIHAKLVMGKAKTWAQQKPGQGEPGLFMLHRKLPAVHPFVQAQPKVAQKSSVPLMPGQSDDAFQVFQDSIGGQPVGLRRRPGECRHDKIPRSSLGLGRGIRLNGR